MYREDDHGKCCVSLSDDSNGKKETRVKVEQLEREGAGHVQGGVKRGKRRQEVDEVDVEVEVEGAVSGL